MDGISSCLSEVSAMPPNTATTTVMRAMRARFLRLATASRCTCGLSLTDLPLPSQKTRYIVFVIKRDISREETIVAQEKWLVTGPKVIDLPVVRSVKVSLLGGRIDVIGTD